MSKLREIDWFLIFFGGSIVISLVLFGYLFLNILDPQKCDNSTFQCRDIQVQHCMKSDEYSRDECIRLVGTGYK